MTFKVDKGVKMPSLKKYPWAEMEVGDSFFIPEMKQTAGLHSLAKRTHDITISVRAEEGGIRVWRIK